MRDFFRIYLDSKVSPRNHYPVGDFENRIHIVNAFSVFDFRNHSDFVSVVLLENPPYRKHVFPCPYKTCGNIVDVIFYSENYIAYVPRSESRKFHLRIRNVNSFSVREFPAVYGDHMHILFVFVDNIKFDKPVVNQNSTADNHII